MQDRLVSRIREFNRFYMPKFDLLGNSYLGSEYSATEARVLFEIYSVDGCSAAEIAKNMNIDKSYLSRIIKKHESRGYIVRSVSPADSRSYELHLTEEGARRTEDFISKSNAQVAGRIEGLDGEDCRRLMAAFDTITELLMR